MFTLFPMVMGMLLVLLPLPMPMRLEGGRRKLKG